VLKRKSIYFIAALLVGVFFTAGCGSSSGGIRVKPSTEGDLLRLLAFVPDNSNYRSFLTYGDKGVWYGQWEMDEINNMDQLRSADEGVGPLWLIMPIDTYYPPSLHVEYLFTGEQWDLYGFDLFTLDRYLFAGEGLDTLTLAETSSSNGRIADSLIDFGYETETLDNDCVLYSRFEDYEFTVEARTMGSDLNRLMLCDQYFAVAKATEVIEDADLAQSGDRNSLADREEYVAAVSVLEAMDPETYGEMISVMFLDGHTYSDPDLYLEVAEKGGPGGDQYSDQLEGYLDGPVLAEYSLVGMAFYHQDDTSFLVMPMVFSDPDVPVDAPSVLADRLYDYFSVRTNQLLREMINWEIDRTELYEVAGVPVGLVVMSYPDPVDVDGVARHRRLLWIDLYYFQDFAFLVTQ